MKGDQKAVMEIEKIELVEKDSVCETRTARVTAPHPDAIRLALWPGPAAAA